MEQVASGTIRLNRRFFDEGNLVINKHKLSQTEQVSYPTVMKYITKKDAEDFDIRTFSGDVLYAILITGMGYTPEDAANLRLGQVFEIVEDEAG